MNGHHTTHEYQPAYLQERVQAYQDAQADGEYILAAVGSLLRWMNRRLARLNGQFVRKGARYDYDRRALV